MTSTLKQPQLFKLSFETNIKQLVAAAIVFLAFFILPIQTIAWLNSPSADQILSGKVAGITTDNTGRYLQVPLVNFQFDTSLRDSGTISFIFGAILITLAIIIVLISFADFRKREHKYS